MEQINSNPQIRSPTLQTVMMVDEFIKENSGEYKKTELWKKLPKKVMWQTYQVIIDYLLNTLKIVYDNEGYIVYIWNPKLVKRIRDQPDLNWNAK